MWAPGMSKIEPPKFPSRNHYVAWLLHHLLFGLNTSNDVFQRKMQFAFKGFDGAEVIYYETAWFGPRIKRAMTEHSEMSLTELEKLGAELRLLKLSALVTRLAKAESNLTNKRLK